MDDLIVSVDADRFLPNGMETIIQTHPNVAAAVICEQRIGTIALVIETHERLTSSDIKQQQLNLIWPTLLEANKIRPIDAEFEKGLVILTILPRKPVAAPHGLRKDHRMSRKRYNSYAQARVWAFMWILI